MALLVAAANGNFTTAATWQIADATSLLNTEAGNANPPTAVGSTARSSTFTPGAIVIDGIGIRLAARNNTTGTVTVNLYNSTDSADVAGTSVTVNISDLPIASLTNNQGGWQFFNFSNVTLVAGKAYAVQVIISSTASIAIYTNGGNNWARFLRTTSTQAPAAGDDMIIAEQKTGAGVALARIVTMDNTNTTAFGSSQTGTNSPILPAISINKGGTLNYGTTASTNYNLRLAGSLVVYGGGTLNIGTVATPIPRNSTAWLEYAIATTAADYGTIIRNEGTYIHQGLSRTSGKNVWTANISANVAALSTSFPVTVDTGWLSGDVVCIGACSTTMQPYESEKATLTASANSTVVLANNMNGTGGASQYPHQIIYGSVSELCLLTRNTGIRGTSANTLNTYMRVNETATANIAWAEFYNHGGGSGYLFRKGFQIHTTSGSYNMSYCSIHDLVAGGCFNFNPANGSPPYSFGGWTISNTVVYEFGSKGFFDSGDSAVEIAQQTTSNNYTFDGLIIMKTGWMGMNITDIGGSYLNTKVIGPNVLGSSYAIYVTEGSTSVGGNWANVHTRMFQGYGLYLTGIFDITINNYTSGVGIQCTAFNAISNCTFNFANIAGPMFTATVFNGFNDFVTFNNSYIGSEQSTMGYSISFGFPGGGGISAVRLGVNDSIIGGQFTNGSFGSTQGDLQLYSGGTLQVTSTNTQWNSIHSPPSSYALMQSLNGKSFISSHKHGGNTQVHKTWLPYGRIEIDQVIYNTNAPSLRMIPSSNVSGQKMISARFDRGMKVGVSNNATVNVSVFTRRSISTDTGGHNYTGNQPRVVLLANPTLGVTSNTVIATHSAVNGVWQQQSGISPTATADGVFEFIVDCDGGSTDFTPGDYSAGWINVDDWSIG